MKAITIIGENNAILTPSAPLPKILRPNEVLIKTIAVALNPTDYKHIARGRPSTVGCDMSGVIEELGPEVTLPLKKGDRVWALFHGSNKLRPDNGAFAEYGWTKEGVALKIPEGMGFEEAATLGVGVLTVGQGLYQEMGLPWPGKQEGGEGGKRQILIWGGSSATGAMGIQFAKLSGFEVITTCSPSNFDYVKSLGADVVFDSRSPTAGEEIRAYTEDKLYYVWDTIGEHGSPAQCAKALASSAPEGQKLHYGDINGVKELPGRDDFVHTVSLAYTASGEYVDIGSFSAPGMPEHYEFAKEWLPFAGKLIAEGKVKAHRMEVRDGGFDGILSGLEDLKNGKVSGVKLVYRVAEP